MIPKEIKVILKILQEHLEIHFFEGGWMLFFNSIFFTILSFISFKINLIEKSPIFFYTMLLSALISTLILILNHSIKSYIDYRLDKIEQQIQETKR